MDGEKKIVVIDDEAFIRLNLERIFQEGQYSVTTFENGNSAIEYLKNNEANLAFLDLNLPDRNGIEILKDIKKIQPDLLVIIITGFASVESAVNALKLGAYDYIKKPFKADAIKLITKLALERQLLSRRVQELSKSREEEKQSFEELLGSSASLKRLREQIEQFAKYDEETVLITGESGVGKELVSRAIHQKSPRSRYPFIEINCASIPENLLESELFGFEKGAFTDAKTKKIGLFEKADKGTIFLDEIGEMSIGLQAKLLRLLENKQIRRLGSTENINVDVRIIAATNKDLNKAIEEKEFRSDLYYRLNVLRIHVPSLRERKDDIIILANYFLEKNNLRFGKSIRGFTKEAEELLVNYDWPGNVRELKNAIDRISIMTHDEMVGKEELPDEIKNNFRRLKENRLAEVIFSSYAGRSLEEIIGEVESQIIINALKTSNNNVSKAARLLNIKRETLRYKLSKYGLLAGEI